jgi:hypothetical protein
METSGTNIILLISVFILLIALAILLKAYKEKLNPEELRLLNYRLGIAGVIISAVLIVCNIYFENYKGVKVTSTLVPVVVFIFSVKSIYQNKSTNSK